MKNTHPPASPEHLLQKIKGDIEHGIGHVKDHISTISANSVPDLSASHLSAKDIIQDAKEALTREVKSLSTKVASVTQPNIATMALADIQAIILNDRPTPYYGTLVALKVNDGKIGRQLIKAVLPEVTSSQDFQKDMAANLTLVMTYEGLKALGLPQSSLDSFPENFKIGMAGRADILGDTGDNDPKHWLAPFGDKGDIHICAAIIANSQATWQAKLAELKQALAPYSDSQNQNTAIEILVTHDFGADGAVKNVFGYRDGISNPEVAGSGIHLANNHERPIAAGEFVLGYQGEAGVISPMPQPEVLGKNGAFMVLRKYQSHVADFNRYCLQQSDNDPAKADQLGAKMFGRWRSGAPITLSPEHDDPALGEDEKRNNNFDYSNDSVGKGCPLGSHARRMNPRNTKDFILSDVRLHRIIRRSVSYGDIVPPHVTKDDGKPRGLIFIGINAHAMDTLEFLQSQWINDGNFMNLGEERDPLLGVHEGNDHAEADVFSVPAEPIRQRHTGILQFNTLQGGEYLFIPSLSALKWISELGENKNNNDTN